MPDPLSVYSDIRATIDAIHEVAAAIETELARFQIYGEPEAIPRALDRVKDLAAKTSSLESSFSACRDPVRQRRSAVRLE